MHSHKVHKSRLGKKSSKINPCFCEQEMLSGRRGWQSGSHTHRDVFMKGVELVAFINKDSLGTRGVSTPSAIA